MTPDPTAGNRLSLEKSPYLLQHAGNPVDWHPWSPEAFERARSEDKPVFLSIGYATCHWCHVMERESFEDPETARLLNRTFVCVKVDREERPDIDAVYMRVCQMLTGSGGWPLTIFMTPDRRPFFAATYLPRHTRFGRAGLAELCAQVERLWQSDRQKILNSAAEIAAGLVKGFEFAPGAPPDDALLARAAAQIAADFDPRWGGFGQAPKFPTPHRLLFLLEMARAGKAPEGLAMVTRTLKAMRRGGIWDHLGFGFHRYATDVQWLLPHFEKMLYDQALLALAYLEGWRAAAEPDLARSAEEIFTYVLRDMTAPEGGFYTAEDADSEGEEGKFYLWTMDQFQAVLGEAAAARWAPILNLAPEGNFREEAGGGLTGANILHLQKPLADWAAALETTADALAAEWEGVRAALFDARRRRIHPLKDDKILTDWNALMIVALARGARRLARPAYAAAAARAAGFILTRMRTPDGGLWHRHREGQAGIRAHLDDYAFLVWGLLELHAATLELDYLEAAAALQTRMVTDFWDDARGGFFLTAAGDHDLPARPKELYDGAVPSGNSVALGTLLQLGRLTGDSRWQELAQRLVQAFAGSVQGQPAAFTHFLSGLAQALTPGSDVVICGASGAPDTLAMLGVVQRMADPGSLALLKTAENAERLGALAPFTRDLAPLPEASATAYVCRDFACRRPITDAAELQDQLVRGDLDGG
jgi:uncharacterized protein YyaL (SSP411 family)